MLSGYYGSSKRLSTAVSALGVTECVLSALQEYSGQGCPKIVQVDLELDEDEEKEKEKGKEKENKLRGKKCKFELRGGKDLIPLR